jgi:regulator of PEP synthase PpsR (kinase-PPPase family)
MTPSAPSCGMYVITSSLSDGGERVAHSIARQFPSANIAVEAVVCESEDADDLAAIVAAAGDSNGVVLNTLVQSEMLAALEARCRERGVPCISLFPPFAECMGRILDQPPVEIPGLYRSSAEQVYQVSCAMVYAVSHDDSANPDQWYLADAVLVGLAGTGKTTLAVFLATLGYKVATCTVGPDDPPPPVVTQLDRRRVFGVSLPPEVLLRHRAVRQQPFSPTSPIPIDDPRRRAFLEADSVHRDHDYADRLFADLGVTVIDRHETSVEASVSEIVELLSHRFEDHPDDLTLEVPVRYSPTQNAVNSSFCSTGLRRSAGSNKVATIHVLTTGFGYSGEMCATAFAAQWPDCRIKVEVMSHIREENLAIAIEKAAEVRGILMLTLIPRALRAAAAALAAERGLEAVDLFGSLIDAITARVQLPPTEELCSYLKSPDKYFRACTAVEYALDHDDGANPEDWTQADLLLLGASRVGKSPLSIFLATFGLRVANYPLCPGVNAPQELEAVDRRRLFGLTMAPDVLVQFRAERQRKLGMEGEYADPACVLSECDEVRAFLKKQRITALNVTGLPIPAVANKILQRLGERLASPTPGPRAAPSPGCVAASGPPIPGAGALTL